MIAAAALAATLLYRAPAGPLRAPSDGIDAISVRLHDAADSPRSASFNVRVHGRTAGDTAVATRVATLPLRAGGARIRADGVALRSGRTTAYRLASGATARLATATVTIRYALPPTLRLPVSATFAVVGPEGRIRRVAFTLGGAARRP